MENKVYTQNELKAQNIITMDYSHLQKQNQRCEVYGNFFGP